MKQRTWLLLEYIANLAKMDNETAAELEREKALLQICIEQAEKNANQLLCAIDKIVEIPYGEYNPFVCDCLFDKLTAVTNASERLDRKDSEHGKTGAAEQTQNQKESAAYTRKPDQKQLNAPAGTAGSCEKDVKNLAAAQTAASPIIAQRPFEGVTLSAFSQEDFVERTVSEINA